MKYLENIKTPGEVYTFGVLLKISLSLFLLEIKVT